MYEPHNMSLLQKQVSSSKHEGQQHAVRYRDSEVNQNGHISIANSYYGLCHLCEADGISVISNSILEYNGVSFQLPSSSQSCDDMK